MSAREFAKVKESLAMMMNYTITHYAIEISAAIANRDKEEKDTEKWWYFQTLASAEFEEFTEIVDAIYPDNLRKMHELTQQLDDETEMQDYREEVS